MAGKRERDNGWEAERAIAVADEGLVLRSTKTFT